MEFFNALSNYNFIKYSLFSIFFISIISSTIGTYIVINRQTYIAGSISHGILGGIGLFNFLYKITLLNIFLPSNGGLIFTIIFSIAIVFLLNKKNERLDSILSIIWSFGMALGIIFIYLTPGYNQEIQKYLFGNILLIDKNKLLILAIFTFIILTIFTLFFNVIFIFGFDEEFIKLKKININLLRFIIVSTISLSIFFLIQIVGILLIIAIFTLPSMISLNLNKNIKTVIFFSFLINLISSFLSFIISYNLNIPLSPVIIIFMSFIYFLTLFFNKVINKN